MQRQRYLFPALALLTVWRLVLLPTCELSPAEAMAAEAGWSWLGTAPLLTLLAKIGMAVSGHSEYGVRLFAPLLALATSVMVFRLARELFDEQTAAWSVVILNVIPAFNLAAIHLTPASLGFAGYAGLALSLSIALRRSAKWHRAWIGAAASMGVLVFGDGANVAALAAVVCALWITPVWRQRLAHPEFWLVVAVWLAGIISWVSWNVAHHWPGVNIAGWLPDWRLVPNVFRCLLLGSPLLIYLAAREMRGALVTIRAGTCRAETSLLIGLAFPLMLGDLACGVWRPWPDAGLGAWHLFAAVLLAQWSTRMITHSLGSKVTLRTLAIALAGFQSLLVMRTDLVRSAGIPWAFTQRLDDRRVFTRFLSADPTGNLHGWRESAKLVRQVIDSSPDNEWTVLADRWQLAAPLSFYLGREIGVADALAGQGASPRSALFITDDVRCKRVPASLARHFEKTETLSIAEIMHGGHKVRTVKIFACLNNRAPDL